MPLKLKFISIIFLLFHGNLYSATVDCANMVISSVTVEGPRDDQHVFQNKLLILFQSECASKRYVHASLDHPAFNGFLSIALAAKASNRKVHIGVNTNEQTGASNQLAHISIAD
ncbi:hypothetical protein M2404_001103 [Rheinheimera pacifica]|uniref:hypothetical protein n=1 Tax=Rheinheimera pacifica TaxID=173990 RepID=UPI0021678A12|nr:hypothetical protein [Rheinheimera pacifica]MCS4306778.1 hypothetical protein [Rheinheimera pacifica]